MIKLYCYYSLFKTWKKCLGVNNMVCIAYPLDLVGDNYQLGFGPSRVLYTCRFNYFFSPTLKVHARLITNKYGSTMAQKMNSCAGMEQWPFTLMETKERKKRVLHCLLLGTPIFHFHWNKVNGSKRQTDVLSWTSTATTTSFLYQSLSNTVIRLGIGTPVLWP